MRMRSFIVPTISFIAGIGAVIGSLCLAEDIFIDSIKNQRRRAKELGAAINDLVPYGSHGDISPEEGVKLQQLHRELSKLYPRLQGAEAVAAFRILHAAATCLAENCESATA